MEIKIFEKIRDFFNTLKEIEVKIRVPKRHRDSKGRFSRFGEPIY